MQTTTIAGVVQGGVNSSAVDLLSNSNSDSSASYSPMNLNSPELYNSPPPPQSQHHHHHHHIHQQHPSNRSHQNINSHNSPNVNNSNSLNNSANLQSQQVFHTFSPTNSNPDSSSTVTGGFFPTCPSPVTTVSPPSPFNSNGYHPGSNQLSQQPQQQQLPPSATAPANATMHGKLEKQQHHSADSTYEVNTATKSKSSLHNGSSVTGTLTSPSGPPSQQISNGMVTGTQTSGSNSNFANESTPPLYPNGSNLMNQRVKLNVGGKIFETLLSTLQKAGDESNLATVAKEAAIKDLPMFIDRDSETFSILLNYLRTGQLLVPSWADFSTVQLLKLDAQFYGVHNSAYLNSLEHFNILKKFNYSVNVKFLVPELIVSEIKGAAEGAKRKEAESKWLNWYKEDMLSFGRVFKASSISSFNAHFIPPHWCSLKVCFVLWNTNCNKEHIALFMKDLSKLHYIEDLEVTEI